MTVTNLYAKEARERYKSITRKNTIWLMVSGMVTWVYSMFTSHN
jgi:hypothetical protein